MAASPARKRWSVGTATPQRGLLPGDFIPLAEECGLITALGEWTLREACEAFQKWRAEGLPLDSVSVNLSPRQFVDANLISVVQRILQQTAIDPACLELQPRRCHGGVEDSNGNTWWVATHIEDVSPEELQRRAAEAEKKQAKV